MEHPGFGWQRNPARLLVLQRLQDPTARPAQLLLSEELSALVQSSTRHYLLVRKRRMGSKLDFWEQLLLGVSVCGSCGGPSIVS